MQVERALAFAVETEPPGLEIRVNFGVFAGRDATSAEIDDLGKLLVPEAGEVSIVAEERHEMAESAEVVLHQVVVEVPQERIPEDEEERRMLSERLVGFAEFWARGCIADRHAEISEL
jgi:hypothetical protein